MDAVEALREALRFYLKPDGADAWNNLTVT
jgi:hypothetical protein